jgi:hypothetical protein
VPPIASALTVALLWCPQPTNRQPMTRGYQPPIRSVLRACPAQRLRTQLPNLLPTSYSDGTLLRPIVRRPRRRQLPPRPRPQGLSLLCLLHRVLMYQLHPLPYLPTPPPAQTPPFSAWGLPVPQGLQLHNLTALGVPVELTYLTRQRLPSNCRQARRNVRG